MVAEIHDLTTLHQTWISFFQKYSDCHNFHTDIPSYEASAEHARSFAHLSHVLTTPLVQTSDGSDTLLWGVV